MVFPALRDCFVAFDSFADNITRDDSNNTIDVFLRNLDSPAAAAFTSAPTVVRAGVPVKFDGSASKGSQQPTGSFTPVANYSWAFQTGTRVSGAVVSQTFPKPGNYVAFLDITDADGNTASVKHPIVVQQPEFKLRAVSKGRLAKALKTGKLKVQVTSTRAAGIRTGLRLRAAKGKRTSALGKTVATVFPTTLGGTKTITLKLAKKTRSRLAKSKKLRKRVPLQTAGKSNNGAPVVSQLAQRKLR